MRGPQEVQPVAWKLVELQPPGQPVDDPALSWLAHGDGCDGRAWEKCQQQQGEGEGDPLDGQRGSG